MLLRVGDIFIVGKKYKACRNRSGKDGSFTVLYLVIGESEEAGVKQDEMILKISLDPIRALVGRSEFIIKKSRALRAEGNNQSISELNRVKASG